MIKNCPIIFIREINVAISSLWNLIIGKVFLTIDIYFCQRGEDTYSERRFFGVEFFKRLNLKFVGRDEMKTLFLFSKKDEKHMWGYVSPKKSMKMMKNWQSSFENWLLKMWKMKSFNRKCQEWSFMCVCVFVSKGRGKFSVQYVSLFEKRRKIHNKKYIIN
jgi:hypothetical protein